MIFVALAALGSSVAAAVAPQPTSVTAEQFSRAIWASAAQSAVNQAEDYGSVVLAELAVRARAGNPTLGTDTITRLLGEARKAYDSARPKVADPVGAMTQMLAAVGTVDVDRKLSSAVRGCLGDMQAFYGRLIDTNLRPDGPAPLASDLVAYQRYELRVLTEFRERAVSDPQLARIFDKTVGSALKVSALEDAASILARHPDLASLPAVKAFRQIADGSFAAGPGAVLESVRSTLRDAGQLNRDIIKGLANVQRELDKFRSVAEYVAGKGSLSVDDLRKLADGALQRHLAEARRLGEAQFAVSFLSSVVGLTDKKLARSIETTGSALIQIGQNVSKFVNLASKGFPSVASAIGGAILTGNIIGAVLSVFSIFGGDSGGADSSQMILDEIREMRKQIRDLHLAMEQGFNRIDEHLNLVFQEMLKQFERIDVKLDIALARIGQVQLEMMRQQEVLSRIERNLGDYFRDNQTAKFAGQKRRCVETATWYPKSPLDEDGLQACLDFFYGVAIDRSKGLAWVRNRDREYDPDKDHSPFSAAERPYENAHFLFRTAARFGNPATSKLDVIPNVVIWAIGAEAYVETLLAVQEHVAAVRPGEPFDVADGVSPKGIDGLIETGTAIRDTLHAMAFSDGQAGSRPRVEYFGALVQEYRNRLDDVRTALKVVQSEFERVNVHGYALYGDARQLETTGGRIDTPPNLTPCSGNGREIASPPWLANMLPSPTILASNLLKQPVSFCYVAEWTDRRESGPYCDAPIRLHGLTVPKPRVFAKHAVFAVRIRAKLNGEQVSDYVVKGSSDAVIGTRNDGAPGLPSPSCPAPPQRVSDDLAQTTARVWPTWRASMSPVQGVLLSSTDENVIGAATNSVNDRLAALRTEFWGSATAGVPSVKNALGANLAVTSALARLSQARDVVAASVELLLPEASQRDDTLRAALFGRTDAVLDGPALKVWMLSDPGAVPGFLAGGASRAEERLDAFVDALVRSLRRDDASVDEVDPIVRRMLDRLKAVRHAHWANAPVVGTQ